MAATAEGNQLSNAVLAFALQGRFPEDVDSLPAVSDAQLQPSIDSLQEVKGKLEAEVHTINEETKEDVGTWVRTAKALQEDIIRSKTMANEIVRQSEAPDTSGEAIVEAESKVQFLNREVQYSQQLHEVLGRIKRATQLLDQVERARDERRILDSLRLLEQSWNALDNVGVGKSCRVIRLLDVRAFELKSSVHETFDHVWNSLISVDSERHTFTLLSQMPEGGMSLADAEVGLQAYKEMDERMEQLWRNIDATIVAPRMQINAQALPAIQVKGDTLTLAGSSTPTADNLLSDLTNLVEFLAERLPPGLLKGMNGHIIGDILPRLLQNWLDREVPTSLIDMTPFSRLVQEAAAFRDTLEKHGYAGFDDLSDWVAQAPAIWLGKCRDTVMDGVRNRLSAGIQGSRQIEKVERRMVTIEQPREEPAAEPGPQFDDVQQDAAAASLNSNEWNDDWGADWGDNTTAPSRPASKPAPVNKAGDTGDSWDWGDENDGGQEIISTDAKELDSSDWGDGDAQTKQQSVGNDAGDSWDWDESPIKESAPPFPSTPASKPTPKATPKPTPKTTTTKTAPMVAKPKGPAPNLAVKAAPKTKEIVLRETYSISSLPDPVLDLLTSVLKNAAALTTDNEEYSLVSGTAAGLFGMPTFALALFRAISPHYYSLSDGGNMYLYNDAMYLADQLTEFAAKWNDRQDLTPRAKSMLRLDNDIRTLRSFANRSYTAEMMTQKTVLHDLLGVSQSIMQQDDLESAIEGGAVRVQAIAATWDKILTRSLWSQAVGSLADSLATRIINDVLELPSIGQDEAYNIASAISQATKLDQLFLPSKLTGTEPAADEVALTAHYAPNWLRLQYLSEVLQSNLNDIRFLWCDRELSLYFTTEEMVDLVKASFEDNPKTRDTIRQIKAKKPLSAPL